jgi:hypothetical protein
MLAVLCFCGRQRVTEALEQQAQAFGDVVSQWLDTGETDRQTDTGETDVSAVR